MPWCTLLLPDHVIRQRCGSVEAGRGRSNCVTEAKSWKGWGTSTAFQSSLLIAPTKFALPTWCTDQVQVSAAVASPHQLHGTLRIAWKCPDPHCLSVDGVMKDQNLRLKSSPRFCVVVHARGVCVCITGRWWQGLWPTCFPLRQTSHPPACWQKLTTILSPWPSWT